MPYRPTAAELRDAVSSRFITWRLFYAGMCLLCLALAIFNAVRIDHAWTGWVCAAGAWLCAAVGEM